MSELLNTQLERVSAWLHGAYNAAQRDNYAAIIVELSKAQEHVQRARTLLDKMREH